MPAEYLGSVDEVYPWVPSSTRDDDDIRWFIQHSHWRPVYHGYAFQSSVVMTDDGRHHAVSWYWQTPELSLVSGPYYSWVLLDVANPEYWYCSNMVAIRPMCTQALTMPPPLGSRGAAYSL